MIKSFQISKKLPIITTILFIFLISCSKKGNTDEITASGTIETTEVNVSAKIGGQIRKLNITEGTSVKVGDTLAVLDHDNWDLQVRQAETIIEQAEAQLALLTNGARSEDILQAESVANQAEISLKSAISDQQRMTNLLSAKSATIKQKEDTDTRVELAQAQLKAGNQQLQKFKKFSRPEDIRAAQARVAQGKSSLEILRKNIADCAILAPVSGIVTHKPVEMGELAGQGTAIATITKLDKVNLMIYVTEVELSRIKLGQTAEVRIDDAKAQTFSGKVIYISPVAEFTPKNVQTKDDRVKLVFGVKIGIENPNGILKPGMPADATLK